MGDAPLHLGTLPGKVASDQRLSQRRTPHGGTPLLAPVVVQIGIPLGTIPDVHVRAG